ncbi:tyrosine-type recombinase/integrase [Ponticaulis koreensis]|uniref:tyrosine-type recombinase/integrase n=1 Tax=Ponticaulis koreensis TaxID=1123045 RepID=UPI0003B3D4A3|nr:tyrosine-type recombinase/integrase [Ponticaulis koreensis]
MNRNLGLKGVSSYQDRHGRTRWRYRSKGRTVSLPSPDHPDFASRLAEARAGGKPKTVTVKPGSIDSLINRYYQTAAFDRLRDSTKTTYRGILENFRSEYGRLSVSGLQRKHIIQILDKMRDRPSAANNLLKLLKILMRVALDHEMRNDNPAISIKPFPIKSEGFRTWGESEIAKYRAKYESGTRERRIFELMLNIGARRSDAVALGRQHIRNGRLEYTQQKTSEFVSVPILGELRVEIDAMPKTQMLFVETEYGQQRSAKAFGNWFREKLNNAGIGKEFSAHGLRKACAVRLADAGCTAPQIQAVTGHRTLKEVQRYIDAADRARGADQAFLRLYGTDGEHNLANHQNRFANSDAKPFENKGK